MCKIARPKLLQWVFFSFFKHNGRPVHSAGSKASFMLVPQAYLGLRPPPRCWAVQAYPSLRHLRRGGVGLSRAYRHQRHGRQACLLSSTRDGGRPEQGLRTGSGTSRHQAPKLGICLSRPYLSAPRVGLSRPRAPSYTSNQGYCVRPIQASSSRLPNLESRQ